MVEYASLYPEYKCVWIGDSGQGDYQAAVSCLEAKGIVMAFIHKVTNFDKIYGYKGDRPNIHFYETYVGAAIAACKAGLIDKQAVERVAQSAKEDFEDLVSDPKVAKKMNVRTAAGTMNLDISTANSTLSLRCASVVY